MKKIIVLLMALFLFCPAMAEEAAEPAIFPADRAMVEAVAQDTWVQDGNTLTTTYYEITVPIHLPVTLRTQQPDGAFDEITITPAVAQITYLMQTYAYAVEGIWGGGVDVLHYPKLSWLGVPPYPGGPHLAQDVLPREILYKADFARTAMPHCGGYGTRDGGHSATVEMSGGSFTLTYVNVITLDGSGAIIDTSVTTETLPYDFAYTFYADAPEYTGELSLPTFAEWMGVDSIPR